MDYDKTLHKQIKYVQSMMNLIKSKMKEIRDKEEYDKQFYQGQITIDIIELCLLNNQKICDSKDEVKKHFNKIFPKTNEILINIKSYINDTKVRKEKLNKLIIELNEEKIKLSEEFEIKESIYSSSTEDMEKYKSLYEKDKIYHDIYLKYTKKNVNTCLEYSDIMRKMIKNEDDIRITYEELNKVKKDRDKIETYTNIFHSMMTEINSLSGVLIRDFFY